MSTHGKTDSEVTSLAPSSPTRPVYFVQSPSRDSHDGEKTTNSFHSTPAVLSPMGSPGRHSRHSSSSTRFSSGSSLKPSSQKSSNNNNNGSRSRRLKQGTEKDWKEFDAINEEEGLLDEDYYFGNNNNKGGIIPKRCYVPAFVVGFFLLFAFFSLILWAAGRNQKPLITMKSISFDQFVIQAGSDPSGVATELVTMNCSLVLTFRNRGTFFGIHVSSTPLDLSYTELTVATGTINSFYQSRKSQRSISVSLRGNGIPLYGGGSDLSSKNGKPQAAVPLSLSFTLRAKAYVLGKLVKPKFLRSVRCLVVLDPQKMNVATSLKNSCIYRLNDGVWRSPRQQVLPLATWSLHFGFASLTTSSRFPRVSKVLSNHTYFRQLSSMAGDSLENAMNGDACTLPPCARTYQVVVAATSDLGIGKDSKLPWRLPSDLKFFKDITSTTSDPEKQNAVIMGRKTWESIPPKFRPLPGRLNVVLSRSKNSDIARDENVVASGSMCSALKMLAESPYSISIERVFVIGGGEVLREALNAPGCEAIHMTKIDTSFECDTFIPPVDSELFQPWYSSSPVEENNIRYCFMTYVRVVTSSSLEPAADLSQELSPKRLRISNFSFLPKLIFEKHDEFLYLGLLQDIIANGINKDDRTGTGTVSKFGCQMRFNLRTSFPLLTTKRVFWRGVVEELLWFISGSTNAKVLQEKNIHIWDGNASREYLDSIGLADREEGDLGPVYGFQWRHFGARYTNMHTDYSGQGFDQLLDVIDKIKNHPDDRRIILSAWNPSDLKLMALPPCHMFAQFYVANGELSCQMYQRSADMGLGVPFNIASYALLTRMIAHVCGLVPGDFIHVIGDAHIYKTHIDPLQEQLQRVPKPFPILKINPLKRDIDSFVADDFELSGYHPHQKIEMKMSV